MFKKKVPHQVIGIHFRSPVTAVGGATEGWASWAILGNSCADLSKREGKEGPSIYRSTVASISDALWN